MLELLKERVRRLSVSDAMTTCFTDSWAKRFIFFEGTMHFVPSFSLYGMTEVLPSVLVPAPVFCFSKEKPHSPLVWNGKKEVLFLSWNAPLSRITASMQWPWRVARSVGDGVAVFSALNHHRRAAVPGSATVACGGST